MEEAPEDIAGQEHNVRVRRKIDFSMLRRRSRFYYYWRNTRNALRTTWTFLWKVTFGRWLFIKPTQGPPEGEAATMTFIRAHTKIPVPRVWSYLSWWGQPYILMSRGPGVELTTAWAACTSETKEKIAMQLSNYVGQLRTLESPYGSKICSVIGGPVWDCRLYDRGTIGPFEDEEHMNRQLRHQTTLDYWLEEEDIQSAHALRHRIVFTHGDLAPCNIMVRDGAITAILDWESSGWFPEHWEYCKAFFASWGHTSASWNPLIPRFVPPYRVEAQADRHLLEICWVPFIRE